MVLNLTVSQCITLKEIVENVVKINDLVAKQACYGLYSI